MDPLTVAGWGLVYAGIGAVVAKVAYRWLIHLGFGGDSGDAFVAFLAMLLWPVLVTTGIFALLWVLLEPVGRVLATSWKWWLQD